MHKTGWSIIRYAEYTMHVFFSFFGFYFVKITSINITVFSYKPSTLELYCENICITGLDSISGTPVVRSNILVLV